MKRLILIALTLVFCAAAQLAKEHWLLMFQLAPGIDLAHLTPEQTAVLTEHRKYVGTLYAKGLVMGGHTNEPVNTLAIAVMACDEATAKAVVADDPATRAGYFKGSVHPFFLMPPAPVAEPAATKPLCNSGRHYGVAGRLKGALVAKFVNRHAPHRFCPSPTIRRPPIDPVKALRTNVARKYP